MLGRRIWRIGADFSFDQGATWKMEFAEVAPGHYWQEADKTWHGRTPNGLFCNLTKHSVVEHEDGTVTASPSILVSGGGLPDWHGYLERGVWREC